MGILENMLAKSVENLGIELHRLQDKQEREITEMRDKLYRAEQETQKLKIEISEWSGGLQLAKWAMGLGIPGILGAVIAHVVRHWSTI